VTHADTPAAVRRYVRRPLWWLPLFLAGAVLMWWADVTTARAADEAFDAGFTALAVVDRDYDGRGDVPLDYEHPLAGTTRAEAPLASSDPPRAGARVAVEVDRDDPRDVVIAGDRYESGALGIYLIVAALPLAVFAVRRSGARRTARLIGEAGPSFSMFAKLTSGGRSRRTVRLNLFPLDGGPHQRALCSVPLLDADRLPVDGPGIPVEVKGSPRPFGRVVARLDDTILWPRGRASGRTERATLPAAIGRPPRFTERDLPPGQLLGSWPRRVGWGLGVLGAAAALLVTVTVVTWSHRGAARDLERHGARVVARVLDDDARALALDVEYQLPGEATVSTGRAPVDHPGDWDVGDRYPAVVDPAEPGRLRLLAEPYDAREPIVWAAIPAVAVTALLARSAWWWRRRQRMRRGPWAEVDAWVVGSDEMVPKLEMIEVALAHPSSTATCCTVRLPLPTRRWWPAGEPRIGLVAAGSLTPGGTVVVRHGDTVVFPVGAARAPRRAPRAFGSTPVWMRRPASLLGRARARLGI
jgi:hypothetical protein